MRAHDIMTPDVITVGPETPLPDLVRLMLARRISAVPVVEDGSPIGIVTEGDLLRRPELGTLAARPRWLLLLFGPERAATDYAQTHGRTAREVMSHPLIAVDEATPIADLAETMARRRIKRLPVLRGGKLVGIVARADLLRALALAPTPGANEDDRRLREAILNELRAAPWLPPGTAPATDLAVQVRDGAAYLWGSVGSGAERDAVIAAAESTPGVCKVVDYLAVRHDADPMDRPNWFTTPPP